MEERLKLGASLLGKTELAPNDVLEADVRYEMGVALLTLERLAEAKAQFVLTQSLAKELKDSTTLALIGWHLGMISYHLGDFEYGIDQARQGAVAAKATDRSDILWRCLNIAGLLEERSGNYVAALDAFAEGMAAAEKSEDLEGVATILGNIGVAQMNLGEYAQARETYLRVRALEIEAGSVAGTSATVANLGDVCIILKEFDQALAFHTEALQMRVEEGVEVELARSFHSLATIHLSLDEYALALSRYEESLEIRKRLHLLPDQAVTLLGMSLTYTCMEDAARADSAVSASLKITDELDMLGRRRSVLEALAWVRREQGQHAAALETYEECLELERKHRSVETSARYAEFEAKLESKDKERQIAALTAEGKLNEAKAQKQLILRRALMGGSALLALLALTGWLAWARLRATNRALSEANEAVRRHSAELKSAASRIERLEGMLPICSHCKSIRDDAGAWHSLERYMTRHSDASFTHSVCPVCVEDHYSDDRLQVGLLPQPPVRKKSEDAAT